MNVNSLSGGFRLYDLKYFWLMFETQCVLFVAFELAILEPLPIDPSLKMIFASFKDEEEKVFGFFNLMLIRFSEYFMEEVSQSYHK